MTTLENNSKGKYGEYIGDVFLVFKGMISSFYDESVLDLRCPIHICFKKNILKNVPQPHLGNFKCPDSL